MANKTADKRISDIDSPYSDAEDMANSSPSDMLARAFPNSTQVSDNTTVKSDRDEHGRFKPGHKGGPGRGHIGTSNTTLSDGSGTGEPLDLMALFNRSLQQYGPEKFAMQLMRKSPVTFAQFMSSMSKMENSGIGQDREVNIIVGGGMGQPGSPEPITSDTSAPSDQQPTETQKESLKKHNQAEEAIQARHKTSESDWRCPTCPVERYWPASQRQCEFCGSKSPRERRRNPAKTGGKVAQCVSSSGSTSHPDRGWKDISHARSIKDGIDSDES